MWNWTMKQISLWNQVVSSKERKKQHLWHRIEIFYFRESQRFKVFFAGGKKTFLFFPHWQHFLSFSCLMWWESIFRGISLSLRKQWKSFSTVWNSEKIRWRKRGQRNEHFFPPDRKFLFLFAREKKNNLVLHKNVLFSLEKKKVVYFSGRIVIRFSKKSDFFSVLEE